MVTNLEKLLVSWLDGRGRWLRAGNDSLPRYLSAQLHCGPNRLGELTSLLRSPSESLYVEQTELGKITLVGLAAWQDCDEILTDDVPEDLMTAWQLIAELREQLKQRSTIEEERDTALQLASEAEGLLQTARQKLSEAQEHQCTADHLQTDDGSADELQRLRQESEKWQSVAGSGRQALAAKAEELRQSERRRDAAEAETAALTKWRRENGEIIEIATKILELERSGSSVRLAVLTP